MNVVGTTNSTHLSTYWYHGNIQKTPCIVSPEHATVFIFPNGTILEYIYTETHGGGVWSPTYKVMPRRPLWLHEKLSESSCSAQYILPCHCETGLNWSESIVNSLTEYQRSKNNLHSLIFKTKKPDPSKVYCLPCCPSAIHYLAIFPFDYSCWKNNGSMVPYVYKIQFFQAGNSIRRPKRETAFTVIVVFSLQANRS